MKQLRYWCYKILPLVYDDALSYYEVLCKMREKINEMIEVLGDIPETVKEYLDTNEFKAFIAQLVDSMYQGTINIDNYGAFGDGITDDTNAIADAVEAANQLGLKLTASGTKTYVMKCENIDNIEIKTDVDFNGATIDVQVSRLIDHIFVIGDKEISKVFVDSGAFGKYKINDSRFFNKVLCVNSPLSWGVRQGFENEKYHMQILACDANGKYINGEYYPEIVPGSYEVQYWDLNLPRITIENITFNVSGSYGCNYIRCWRPHVTLKNLTFKGTTTYVGAGWSECIRVRGYDIEVLNCSGGNPWRYDSGYVWAFDVVSDLVMRNIYASELNGQIVDAQQFTSMGNGYLQNCTFENLNMFRWDCHYEMMGNITIRNCVLTGANTCGGWGNFLMENCTFINQTRDAAVVRRNDCRLLYSGTLTFKNLVFEGSTRSDSGVRRPFDFSVSGEDIDITKANYDFTQYIFDHIYTPAFTGYEWLTIKFWAMQDYADKTYVKIKNCVFTCVNDNPITLQVVGNIRQDATPARIKSFEVLNCTTEHFVVSDIRADVIKFNNCNFIDCYLYIQQNSYGSFYLTDCILTSLSGITNISNRSTECLVITGNTFTNDYILPQTAEEFLSLLANNNIVKTELHDGQSSLNNIII